MYDLPDNSLLPHLRPLFQERSYYGDIKIKDFAKKVSNYLSSPKSTPETDVLKFYFLNHAFHIITSKFGPLDPLPEDVRKIVDSRSKKSSDISSRVLCHTFLTLLYEANWLYHGQKSGKFYESHVARFGKPLADHFARSGSGGFSLGVYKDYVNIDATCGNYCRALFNIYTTSPHMSAITKDKQWIEIASVPTDFFMGRLSLEEACDKAFSLFHWGGSIFNKNILYKVNTDNMQKFLDVQDAGQIPQWLNANLNNSFVDNELREVFTLFKKHFPEEVSGMLDNKKIQDATTKRQKGLQNTVAQRGGGNWGGGRNNAGQKEEAPPTQKIDEIVFKGLGLK